MEKKLAMIGGWLGMLLLQGATVPQLVQKLMDPANAELAPLSMVLMVWVGLALYLVRAIAQKDWLYITSNGIGMFLNSILMGCIIFQ